MKDFVKPVKRSGLHWKGERKNWRILSQQSCDPNFHFRFVLLAAVWKMVQYRNCSYCLGHTDREVCSKIVGRVLEQWFECVCPDIPQSCTLYNIPGVHMVDKKKWHISIVNQWNVFLSNWNVFNNSALLLAIANIYINTKRLILYNVEYYWSALRIISFNPFTNPMT